MLSHFAAQMTGRFGQLVFRIAASINQVMAELPNHPPSGVEPLSPERRARIIAGAAEIFTRDGYEGASMAQIAQAARVSKGTLYNYFPGKDALFAAFVKDNCGRLMQEIFDGMRDDAAVADELARIGRTMLKMVISPRALTMFRVVVMEAQKFPELARTFVESGPDILVSSMAAWIGRRIDAGELAADDPHFAAEQFFALIQSRIVLRTRIDAAFSASAGDIDYVVGGAVRVFLAYYGKPAF